MSTAILTCFLSRIKSFRYSMQNVQARIQNDGTVVPVTAPKQLENGLYQRPIGRQRKGMDWDAVRGVWIPTSDDVP